ncbi:unnamed protein product [Prorocentrum cordatum]|uniref:Uncharacterized protein n=1 Tax=Prorocentrum cordatum TaxID=2364126 RepID=A0ABN9X905_9DINO|nr:unnamed protein product [Polarella glacialis]
MLLLPGCDGPPHARRQPNVGPIFFLSVACGAQPATRTAEGGCWCSSLWRRSTSQFWQFSWMPDAVEPGTLRSGSATAVVFMILGGQVVVYIFLFATLQCDFHVHVDLSSNWRAHDGPEMYPTRPNTASR